MLWFIVPSVIGFVAYSAWQRYSPSISRRRIITVAIAVGVFAVAIGPWLLFFAPAGTLRKLSIEGDELARLLLGLIFGAGVAHIKAQYPLSLSFWLPVGGAVLLLALGAPHVDSWLSRLSGFKTALIEIQLTGLSSASKALQPVQREGFIRGRFLEYLSKYDQSIADDIQFIDQFETKDPKRSEQESGKKGESNELGNQRDQLERLKAFFGTVVSPAARCFKTAMDNGLNKDSAQRDLADLADQLTIRIILEKQEAKAQGAGPSAAQESEEIVRRIAKLAGKIRDSIGIVMERISPYLELSDQTQCRRIREAIAVEGPPAQSEYDIALVGSKDNPGPGGAAHPSHLEYDSLPHLLIARSMLLAFVDNDRLALEVAKEAERKDFKDFYTPLILASLMYFKGDSVKEFYEILNRVRLLARERQDVIKRVIDACARPCVTQELASRLRVRARRMELTAMNNIAYAVAADVAEGRKEAEALLPIAVEYADDLREADKKDPEASDDTFLDTAAFVTIVAEAHRARSKMTNLNKKKIEEAITLLEKLDAKEQARISAELKDRDEKKRGQIIDYSTFKTIRTHLASARGLLE